MAFMSPTTGWLAAGAIACCAAACGTDPSIATDPPSADGGPSEPEGEEGQGVARDGGWESREDGGDASSSSDAATRACTQGAPCAEGTSCYSDDGVKYHECRCSAGKLGCLDFPAAPPTGCVAGSACMTAGATCAVDDGTKPVYCTCNANKWDCLSLGSGTQGCVVDTGTCSYPPAPDATTWIGCYKRSSPPGTGNGLAVRCTKNAGGVAADGISVERVCPALTPTSGTRCDPEPIGPDFYSIPGLYCGCKKQNGTPCVCGCRRSAPYTEVSWLCLP